MKKARYIVPAALLTMSMIAMTACGGSLSADTGNEKSMVITTGKATGTVTISVLPAE